MALVDLLVVGMVVCIRVDPEGLINNKPTVKPRICVLFKLLYYSTTTSFSLRKIDSLRHQDKVKSFSELTGELEPPQISP